MMSRVFRRRDRIRRPALRQGLAMFVMLGSAVLAQALPRWNAILRQPDGWYGTEEARLVAAAVMRYQTSVGGWPKNIDMTQPPKAKPADRESTIDNGATTTQIRFLARVAAARESQEPMLVTAVERGIDYLLEAQYDNGGWPQYYPLRNGYYSHVTFNDNAMVNVLRVLHDIGRREEPFAWVGHERRERAKAAVERGIQCILRAQITVNGRLTAWCAQHDAVTLEPAPARAFEPISLSGYESAEVVEFLIEAAEPTEDVVRAVEAAVAWLEEVKLSGWRIDRPALEGGRHDRVVIHDPAAPPVWARFYELGTNRPIFAGRSAEVHYDIAAIEPERRSGYAYFGTWANDLLETKYPRWKTMLASRKDES